MKIQGAIILVELDDNKVYQVDVSSGDVMQYLSIITMKQKDFKLPILDKPLIGMTLTRVLNEETRKDYEEDICPMDKDIKPSKCHYLNNGCSMCVDKANIA